MTDSPEHIWLLPYDGEQRCWCNHPDPCGTGHGDEATEYIRADMVEEMKDEIDRLRKSLTFYADVGKYVAPLTGGQGDLYFDCGARAMAALTGETQK